MLEAASSLGYLLLPSFERDTYPDREFPPPLQHALQRMFLTSIGLIGQDMRHLDKIWVMLTYSLLDWKSNIYRALSTCWSAINTVSISWREISR
jgi:hypothetical protein